MNHDARFYFANLGADVARCIGAAESNDEEDYSDSLSRAYDTLDWLQEQPRAFEEGLLMIRGLEEARRANRLPIFRQQLNNLIAEFVPA